MPNKQLTAKVRLNTSQAEQAIDRLSRKIAALNNAINRQSSSTQQTTKHWQKVNSKVQQVANSSSRLASIYNNTVSKLKQVTSKVQEWWSKQKQVTSATKSTGSALGSIWRTLKGIAATYLGIMGIGKMFGVADTIISAENKLNYVGAQQLGDKAYNADGSYSPAVFQYTEGAMNKMYNSAQKVRMGYSDMMSNVSKSMVLAGDAFNYSTDNAIRFQEVMAEAYAIGGASNSEMHSSMYQLIQALGSGTLAGDELRSVREGAPLAYAAIEKFVQGVYNTDESLKDLASQGKVTADMVVAAVLNAGDDMDTAFAQTAQTFNQTWQQIKNAAMKSFIPVANRLRDILNKAVDSGLVSKVEKVFDKIADIVISTIDWIADNWGWLEELIKEGLALLTGYMVADLAVMAASWLKMKWKILLVGAAISSLIYIFSLWEEGAISTTDAISNALYGVAAMGLIAAAFVGGWVTVIIAVILALVGLAIAKIDNVIAKFYQARAQIINIGRYTVNTFVAMYNALDAIGYNIKTFFVKIGHAISSFFSATANNLNALGVFLWTVLSAVCENIGIGFENACAIATNAFWDFVSAASKALVALMAPLNAVLGVLGLDTITVETIETAAANNKKELKSTKSISSVWDKNFNIYAQNYQDYSDALSEGWNSVEYRSVSDAWDAGMSTYKYLNVDRETLKGMAKGKEVKDKINNYTFDDLLGDATDKITNTLNDAVTSALEDNPLNILNPDSAEDILGGGPGGGVAGSSGKTADNTGSMADSMELAEEDLSFLRDLADKEWKKEFTTASIQIDMSNVNTINNQGDLDGWVTTLADKLREELSAVADGVYV